jgi:hypothetical protein
MFFIALFAIYIGSLAGCGSGGGVAASGTTINQGVVAATGNISVNGYFYNISSAGILIDGVPGKKSDLQAGMLVTVRGIFDNRTSHALLRKATSVEYISDFQGPVDCVNILDNSLTILGQQVLVSTTAPQTVFANFTSTGPIFANISTVPKLNPHLSPQLDTQLYNVVKISGFSNGANGFQATRVELVAQNVDLTTSVPIEIRGIISNEDIPGQAFTIGNLTIDYSTMNPADVPNPFAPSPFNNLSTANPLFLPHPFDNGLFVTVKGLSSDFEPGNAPTLSPTSITIIKQGIQARDGDHVTLTGFVTGLSGTSFLIGGNVVSTENISLNGIENAELVVVDGTFKKGVLVASSVTPL